MQNKKCDYDYKNNNLHIHKNKCEKCKYSEKCDYIKQLKKDKPEIN